MMVLSTSSYATCDFNNDLCRPNPLMDRNEARLQEIERNQQKLQQQQKQLEQQQIEDQLQQSNSNRYR